MADVQTGSYQPLQAPQQQQLTPLGVLQLIGQMQSNAIQRQELDSRQAIGDLYKGAIDPNTGLLDQNKLMRGAPLTGVHAPDVVQSATQNVSGISDLNSKYQGILRNVFGELGTLPVITDLDVAKRKAAAAAQGVPAGAIQEYVSQIPQYNSKKGQEAAKDYFTSQSNMAQGPGYYSGGQTIQTNNGDVQIPQGLAARARTAGGLPVTRPYGAPEADIESQKSLVADQRASAGTIANLRNLDIALPMAQKLSNPNFGPGSSEFAKLKARAVTAGLIDPNTSDLTVRQELNKYLLKYATQAQNAGRSDQALAAAVGSNPNLDLTQPANLGLIKNQIGLDKMDAAMPKMFVVEHPNPSERAQYNDYKSDYYNRFDRRAFSYDKLSPEERRSLIQSLGPKNSPAYQKFNQTYQIAKHAGFIVPEKQENQ